MNDARERILHHVARMGFHRAYEVGGAVRDGLRGLGVKDVDIAIVGHTFDELLALCRAEGSAAELVVARQRVGVRLTAPWTPREGVEFALARTEVSTGASRHQFAIDTHPGVTIEEDLARRDFTVNAIAREVSSGALIDPFGGARDLRAGVLRTVSERSFPEDPLRVLRGLVRCARDELAPEPTTAAQMRAWAADPRRYLGHAVDEASTGYRWYGDVPLSPERVYQELRKLLAARHAAHALRIARDTGVLAVLLPEFQDSIGFDQRSRYHDLTVDEHTFGVLDHACAVGAPETVRLAALLHDCGKPATAWGYAADGRPAPAAEVGGPLHFYARPGDPPGRAHEVEGAERAQRALLRLAAPTAVREKVVRLVREHMYSDDNAIATLAPGARGRRARRFLQRIGTDTVEELLLLRRCDRAGKREVLAAGWDAELTLFEAAVREQRRRGAAIGVNDLAIDGHELATIGFSGHEIGEAKRRLLELVVEDPASNVPAVLRQAALELRSAGT